MDLGNLLAGLVTVSISSVVTFRSLKVAVNVSHDNVNINGNNNIVIQQKYEQSTSHQTQENSILAVLVGVAVSLAYPFIGKQINVALEVLSVAGAMLSLIAWFSIMRAYGGQRLWNTVNCIGALLICWIMNRSQPYLHEAVTRAVKIPEQLQALFASSGLSGTVPAFSELGANILAVGGIGGLLTCSLLSIFGFMDFYRSFNQAWLRTVPLVGGALVATFFATHCATALFWYSDYAYALRVFHALIGQ